MRKFRPDKTSYANIEGHCNKTSVIQSSSNLVCVFLQCFEWFLHSSHLKTVKLSLHLLIAHIKVETTKIVISPADGSTLHIEDLEMFGTMKFFCIFALLRGPRVILALLPLWQLWAIFFICIKPKWPPNCETETQLLNYLPQNVL